MTDRQTDMRAAQSLIHFAVVWCGVVCFALFILHIDSIIVPE